MVGEVGDGLFARQATDFWPKLSNACCVDALAATVLQKKKMTKK
jgi:hypothetical protein